MSDPTPVLARSEVAFMYDSTPEFYRRYEATFVAWGRSNTPEKVAMHHELAIRCASHMWCLTAGAKKLHADPALREAVTVDFLGDPVVVPWQADRSHEGTPPWFGCTNTPAFRELNRAQAREAMAAGADSLHVDDPLGTAGSIWYGGGFCPRCMEGFREYLRTADADDELRDAGVGELDSFDYRQIVAARASTREQYLDIREDLPLMGHFERFHRRAAAENVRGIIAAGRESAGRDILASVNAHNLAEAFEPIVALDEVTHVVAEVDQNLKPGAPVEARPIEVYRKAERMTKPLVATAGGIDWAWAKAHNCVHRPKVWIAQAYAHGQLFMTPHPQRQWCHSFEFGNHWYAAPAEEYAPIYRFIRGNAELFDDYQAADVEDVRAPDGMDVTVRRRDGGPVVVHVVNTDGIGRRFYGDCITPAENVTIDLPAGAVGDRESVRLLSYDADPAPAPVRRDGGRASFVVPTQRVWTVCVFE